MKDPIRLLLIEDSVEIREIIIDHLSELYSNCKIDVIESFDGLEIHYKPGYYDIVICDFKLKDYKGIDVLFYIREKDFNLPFIFVSDTFWGDELIDILALNGASDYVMKDNLKQLKFVVRREIGRSRRINQTNQQLEKSEFRFRSLVQSINGIVREVDLKTLENIYVSPQTLSILGYPSSDWFKNKYFWRDHIHPDDREESITKLKKAIKEGGNHTLEYRMIRSGGDIVWIRDLISIRVEDGEPVSVDGLMINISEEKYIENQRDLALLSEKRRMKEQKCLWNITSLDEQEFSIPQLIQRSMMHLPIGFRYPTIIAASVRYGEEEYQTGNYEESSVSLVTKNDKIRNGPLSIEVVYLDESKFKDAEPFLKDERHLLDTILDILSIKIVKKLSTDDLKKHEQLLINTYELAQLGRLL